MIYITHTFRRKGGEIKPPLLHSTLIPDTNSDSPSTTSQGVRLVSPNLVTDRTELKGKLCYYNIKKCYNSCCFLQRLLLTVV